MVANNQIAQICGDDKLCLFDIAATGDVNIGQSTKETGQDLATITELLKPSKTHYTCTCESEEYFFTSSCL